MTTWGGTQYAWASLPIFALGIVGVVMLAGFVVVERRVTRADPPLPALPHPGVQRRQRRRVRHRVRDVRRDHLPARLPAAGRRRERHQLGAEHPAADGGAAGRIDLERSDHQPRGRYKIFPVIGTALAAIGVYLLSTIDPQTPRFFLSMYMVVLGLGLGCVMQVLVIAVQNAVEQRDLGVGTSSATFLRSMGASFGVAIFGAIFSNQLAVQPQEESARERAALRDQSRLARGEPGTARPPAAGDPHRPHQRGVGVPPCRLSHRRADPGGRVLPDPADQGGPAAHQGAGIPAADEPVGTRRGDRTSAGATPVEAGVGSERRLTGLTHRRLDCSR